MTERDLILDLGFAIEDPLGVDTVVLARALVKFGERIPPDQRRTVAAALDQQFSRQSRLQDAQNAATAATNADATPTQAVEAAGLVDPNRVLQPAANLIHFLEHTVDILVGEVADQSLARPHADLRLEQLMNYDNLQPYEREFVRGYFEGRLQMRRP